MLKSLTILKKLKELLPYIISIVEVLSNKDINGNGKVGE